MTPEISIPC